MKRLFLTSSGLSAFSSFVGKHPKTITIGFIPTAADPYQDKWFVEKDRKFFLEQGFEVVDVDIKVKSELEKLNNVDVIYVAGGNSYYLLEKAIDSGALELMRKLVNAGKPYAGGSAGAVFAGPSVEPVSLLDDPKAAPNLKTHRSLCLVDFVIIPHYGKEKYAERHKKILEDFKDSKFKLITLTDEQAIIVEGDNFQIVESK